MIASLLVIVVPWVTIVQLSGGHPGIAWIPLSASITLGFASLITSAAWTLVRCAQVYDW